MVQSILPRWKVVAVPLLWATLISIPLVHLYKKEQDPHARNAEKVAQYTWYQGSGAGKSRDKSFSTVGEYGYRVDVDLDEQNKKRLRIQEVLGEDLKHIFEDEGADGTLDAVYRAELSQESKTFLDRKIYDMWRIPITSERTGLYHQHLTNILARFEGQ